MPKLRANGIDLYYETAGSGPRILFISGTGGDLRNRPNVFDGPLAGAFEVLAYDQRGLGQSDKPEGPYTMADYADDAAALLHRLGWAPHGVVGVSFGGMVAQELALRHPGCVQRLVLACTSSGGEGGASYPLHELAGLDPRRRAERQVERSDLRCDAAWRDAHPERWEALVARALEAQRPDRDPAGAFRQLEARAGHDTYARLGALAMPVLVMGGEFDGIAPKENVEALAARIPHATLRFFAGGHLFLIQDKTAYPFMIQWLGV